MLKHLDTDVLKTLEQIFEKCTIYNKYADGIEVEESCVMAFCRQNCILPGQFDRQLGDDQRKFGVRRVISLSSKEIREALNIRREKRLSEWRTAAIAALFGAVAGIAIMLVTKLIIPPVDSSEELVSRMREMEQKIYIIEQGLETMRSEFTNPGKVSFTKEESQSLSTTFEEDNDETHR